jgi:hypothetical protein
MIRILIRYVISTNFGIRNLTENFLNSSLFIVFALFKSTLRLLASRQIDLVNDMCKHPYDLPTTKSSILQHWSGVVAVLILDCLFILIATLRFAKCTRNGRARVVYGDESMSWKDAALIPSRGKTISPMWECACGYGSCNLGSGYQQHSNNLSSMMYGSDLGSICYIHELRKRTGRELRLLECC